MNIVVCVKQVPAIDFEFGFDEKNGILEEDLIWIINPYDAAAVEEALRLRKSCGCGKVTIISVGPSSTDDLLRKCLAMGADEVLRVWDRTFENSDAWVISEILAKVIINIAHDIVLCGRKSIDTNDCQIGELLSVKMGMPHIYAACKIEIENSMKAAVVHRMGDGGAREVFHCALPAVFSVDVEIGEPRYPSLPGWIKAVNQEIQCLNARDLGLNRRAVGRSGSLTKIGKYFEPRKRYKKIGCIDSRGSAVDRLEMVMSGGVQDRGNCEILDGSPDVIAEKVVDILIAKGFLQLKTKKDL